MVHVYRVLSCHHRQQHLRQCIRRHVLYHVSSFFLMILRFGHWLIRSSSQLIKQGSSSRMHFLIHSVLHERDFSPINHSAGSFLFFWTAWKSKEYVVNLPWLVLDNQSKQTSASCWSWQDNSLEAGIDQSSSIGYSAIGSKTIYTEISRESWGSIDEG